MTIQRARTTDRTSPLPAVRRSRRRPASRQLGRGLALGIIGIAIVLGLGLALPLSSSETALDLVAQSLWRNPVPAFLSPGPQVQAPALSPRGLVSTEPPRALTAPAVAKNEPQAAVKQAGVPVRVYFPRRPDSDSQFSAVFPVARVAADQGVATAALRSLIEGPTAAERSQGYYSELGAALTGSSTCSGRDFRIAIVDGTATVTFCRAIVSAGIGQDARIRSQLEATLRQFSTIKAIRLLDKDGHCLFDQSGQDRCLAGQATTALKSSPQNGSR